jgi:hypothetical protein
MNEQKQVRAVAAQVVRELPDASVAAQTEALFARVGGALRSEVGEDEERALIGATALVVGARASLAGQAVLAASGTVAEARAAAERSLVEDDPTGEIREFATRRLDEAARHKAKSDAEDELPLTLNPFHDEGEIFVYSLTDEEAQGLSPLSPASLERLAAWARLHVAIAEERLADFRSDFET